MLKNIIPHHVDLVDYVWKETRDDWPAEQRGKSSDVKSPVALILESTLWPWSRELVHAKCKAKMPKVAIIGMRKLPCQLTDN